MIAPMLTIKIDFAALTPGEEGHELWLLLQGLADDLRWTKEFPIGKQGRLVNGANHILGRWKIISTDPAEQHGTDLGTQLFETACAINRVASIAARNDPGVSPVFEKIRHTAARLTTPELQEARDADIAEARRLLDAE